GMGRELYRREPLFRRCIDECDAVFRELTGQSLIEVLYAAPNGDEVAELRLAQTELTQPALFAIEYALARVWMNWGIQPVALLGHSIGEYVAACVAGVFSAADGLRLVAERARRMQHAPGDGVMVAAMAEESKIRAALQGVESVAIGVHNAARNHVLSGERSAVEQVVARLQAQGVETRALRVSHAFHSPLMTPVLAGFADVVAQVAGKNGFAPPSIAVISNITGQAIGAELTQPGYWVDHLRSAVNFAAGIQAMRAAGVDAFIEIGPRPTLLALAQQQVDEADVLWLPSLRPQTDDSRQMLETLAGLSVKGAKIDWRRFAGSSERVARSPLPTYPFQRRRYWLPAVTAVAAVATSAPFPGRRIASPLMPHTIFENIYDASRFTLLGEHRVFDQVVVPGAAHLSLLVEAAERFFAASPCELHDVVFPRALVVPEPGARRVQLLMKANGKANGGDPIDFNLISLPLESDEGWEEHANGRLTRLDASAAGGGESLASLRKQCDRLVSADFYRELWQSAIGLGARFRWVKEVWRDGPYRVLARLQRPQEAHNESYRLHPGMLDSVLQVLVAAIERQADQALVPFSFESFRWWAPVQGEELWSYVSRRENEGDANEVVSDVSLFDAEGRLLAEARGFRARRIESRNLLRAKANPLEDAVYAVEWRRADDAAVIASSASSLGGRWLVVGAARAEVDVLAQLLEAQRGVECVRAYLDHDSGLTLPLDDA
ncbi:MAG TPA: acyltransferase domain-containing protein, partial [Rhodocyclaceae bacterium]|nr:acyltransferase domain-containing protein [Rhodocyclaceae bacterium]